MAYKFQQISVAKARGSQISSEFYNEIGSRELQQDCRKKLGDPKTEGTETALKRCNWKEVL